MPKSRAGTVLPFRRPDSAGTAHRWAHRAAARDVRDGWRALHRALDQRDWLWSEPAPPWRDLETGEVVADPGLARDRLDCAGVRVGWERRWQGVREWIAELNRDLDGAEERLRSLEAACDEHCLRDMR